MVSKPKPKRGPVRTPVRVSSSPDGAPTYGIADFGWTPGRGPLPSDKQVGLSLGAHYLAASVCGHERPAVPWPCEACLDRASEALQTLRRQWGFQ